MREEEELWQDGGLISIGAFILGTIIGYLHRGLSPDIVANVPEHEHTDALDCCFSAAAIIPLNFKANLIRCVESLDSVPPPSAILGVPILTFASVCDGHAANPPH